MHTLKWIILGLALIQGGWLTFDGGRAFVVGDYLTAKSGPRAGQLGPWSRLVSMFGLEPRSNFIKGLHIFMGIAWLIASILLLARPDLGRWAMLGCAVGTLWYLPIGTLASSIVLAILFFTRGH